MNAKGRGFAPRPIGKASAVHAPASDPLGSASDPPVAELIGEYRFYAHPVRYTSLAMALCEAMMGGSPVVAVAATEIPAVIRHGVSGFMATSVDGLAGGMRTLLDDPRAAADMGREARRDARRRFSLDRFRDDWNRVLTGAAADGGGRGGDRPVAGAHGKETT